MILFVGMNGKTVVVTGAPGWLGTRLVEALTGTLGSWPVCAPARVRCLVEPGVDESTLRSLGAQTFSLDLTRPRGLDEALRGADTVFHLAGIIHPRRIRDLYDLNTEGTRAVLEAAVRAGARRFIYVSSNSAGGINADPRVLLDEHSASPELNYGRSKRLAEISVLAAHRAGAIEGVIIRPCWFYGPRCPERQMRFYRMIGSGRPVLFGDGSYLRSLSYVDNTVQGLIRAAITPEAGGQIYWIADERPYSVGEIYAAAARHLGVVRLRPRPIPEWISRLCRRLDAATQAAGFYVPEVHVAGEFIQHIACSVDKARRDLGYMPAVALDEGMRLTVAWCKTSGRLKV